MMEIREKPVQAAHIKEKVISAPKELLRKGLDDGTERLRTQFRDTAQQGQRDEYGGDAVEDTAAGAVRRAEKLLRKRGEHTERRTAPEGENAPGPRSGTTSYHAGRTRGTSALYSSSQQNRAEEVYVRRAAGPKTGEAHTGKWPTGGNAEQGRRAFIRERGRKTAQRRLRDRRDILWYRNGGAQTGDTLYGEDDSHPAGRIKERDMSSHCISGSIKIAKMLSNASIAVWIRFFNITTSHLRHSYGTDSGKGQKNRRACGRCLGTGYPAGIREAMRIDCLGKDLSNSGRKAQRRFLRICE